MKNFMKWMFAGISIGVIGTVLSYVSYSIGFYVGGGPNHDEGRTFIYVLMGTWSLLAVAFGLGRASVEDRMSLQQREKIKTIFRKMEQDIKGLESRNRWMAESNQWMDDALNKLEAEIAAQRAGTSE
jgi:hypothetical protein